MEEKEIIDLVNECKNKTSTDFNETEIDSSEEGYKGGMSKPLTYICRLSFQTSTFWNKVKIANVYGELFFIRVSDWF